MDYKTENVLLDTFSVSGSDYEEFRENVTALTDITKAMVIRGGDIVYLSPCNIPEVQVEGKMAFFVLNEEYLSDFKKEGVQLRVGYIPEDKLTPELVREAKKGKEMLALMDGNNVYFVSNGALPTLTLRAGVGGTATLENQSIFRDAHIADETIRRNETIHVVYREVEQDGKKVRKIFAGLGRMFKPVPQTALLDIVDFFAKEGVCGNIECRSWHIDHTFTRVFLNLPDMADDIASVYRLPHKIMPGLCIQTSDTGAASLTIRGLYFVGHSYVVTDEVLCKHTKNLELETVMDSVDEKIFTKIRKLPEALAELIGRDVSPAAADLTSAEGQAENLQAVTEELRRVAKAALKGVLLKDNQSALIKAVVAEVNPEVHYTGYDVAMIFLGIPDRLVGMGRNQIEALRKACASVPLWLLKNPAKPGGRAREEEVYLLPE